MHAQCTLWHAQTALSRHTHLASLLMWLSLHLPTCQRAGWLGHCNLTPPAPGGASLSRSLVSKSSKAVAHGICLHLGTSGHRAARTRLSGHCLERALGKPHKCERRGTLTLTRRLPVSVSALRAAVLAARVETLVPAAPMRRYATAHRGAHNHDKFCTTRTRCLGMRVLCQATPRPGEVRKIFLPGNRRQQARRSHAGTDAHAQQAM